MAIQPLQSFKRHWMKDSFVNYLRRFAIAPFLSLTFLCLIIIVSLFNFSANALAETGCPPGMVLIPGGTFQIGSDDPRFVEERSAAEVTIDRFCIDQTEVTNAQFAAFVQATGYQTVAERPLSKQQFPDLPEEQRSPGSLVFQMPEPNAKSVPLLSWWQWTIGANWQHPSGPESTIAGKDSYPMIHIAYDDAVAYANWINKSLPTETQWEFAARGGLTDAVDQYSEKYANTWQGIFPFFNTRADRYSGIAPVGSFAPNGYRLYDTAGNVWEWTSDWYHVGHRSKTHQSNPTGPSQAESFDPNKLEAPLLHVIKGGSYLCAVNYCSRARPTARESEAPDTGTTHIGFRLIKNLT